MTISHHHESSFCLVLDMIHLGLLAWIETGNGQSPTHHFYIVTERVQHKGTVVVLMIDGTEARRAITLASSSDGGLVEGVDSCMVYLISP